MAIEKVRDYFKQWNIETRILEYQISSATVELAAQAVGCAPERIAEILSFKLVEKCVLVVVAGDARIEGKNAELKRFHGLGRARN